MEQHLQDIPSKLLEGITTESLNITNCEVCGKPQEPQYIEIWNKWIKAPKICDKCKENQIWQNLKKERDKNRIKKSQEIIDNSNLSKRFLQRTFENFQVSKENKKAFEMSKRYVNSFEERADKGEGIAFVGSYGTGKTHLAGAILQEVLKQGKTGIFVTVPDLIQNIMTSWDKGTERELINTIINCDLLVLDDIGAEVPKDWKQEKMYIIINKRYENMKPVLLTSNCSIEELETSLGGRITSRLAEMTHTVTITGDDFRKRI